MAGKRTIQGVGLPIGRSGAEPDLIRWSSGKCGSENLRARIGLPLHSVVELLPEKGRVPTEDMGLASNCAIETGKNWASVVSDASSIWIGRHAIPPGG